MSRVLGQHSQNQGTTVTRGSANSRTGRWRKEDQRLKAIPGFSELNTKLDYKRPSKNKLSGGGVLGS